MKKPQQLELKSYSHGGARPGAGRKKANGKRKVPHGKRATVQSKHPLLVTVRLMKGTLRNKRGFRAFRRAVSRAKKYGLRILEFAILGDHYHLLVEADSNAILTRGMKSLNGALAKAAGIKIGDRFHLETLANPTRYRNALIYLFANAAKHFRRTRVFDFFSSLTHFKKVKPLARLREDLDWRVTRVSAAVAGMYESMVSLPESWLARGGWTRGMV